MSTATYYQYCNVLRVLPNCRGFRAAVNFVPLDYRDIVMNVNIHVCKDSTFRKVKRPSVKATDIRVSLVEHVLRHLIRRHREGEVLEVISGHFMSLK
jgi:hypothetical protein